jgi:hypothetical protein
VKALFSALVSLIIVLTSSVNAQVVSKGSLQLTKPRALRQKVAAMPLILNPKSAEQRRINDVLRKIDVSMRSALAECDKDYSDLTQQRGQKNPGQPTRGDWTRTITVTMAGPIYLSYLIADLNYCGGAHPSFSESALVYDLRTGLPVDWTAQLPAGEAKLNPEHDWNSIPAQQISDKSMQTYYAGHLTDKVCQKIVREDDDFSLLVWPDAKRGMLTLGTNLPHVDEACAEHVSITDEETRRLGFSDTFLQTIEVTTKR